MMKRHLNKSFVISLCVIVIVIDISFSSLFLSFSQRITKRNLETDFYSFQFSKSVVDMWLQSMLRICILTGALLGFVRNFKDGKARAVKTVKVVKFIAIGLELVLVVKLLYWAEDSKKYLRSMVWVFFVTSFMFNILFFGMWKVFCCVHLPRKSSRLNISTGDFLETHTCDDGEGSESSDSESDASENASENASGDGTMLEYVLGDENQNSKKLGSWTIILKLLRLSKPDLPILLPGFLCLIIAATGDIFLPLYTGRVIDGITIRRDYSEFTHSILIMAFLSMGVGLFSGLRGLLLSLVTARFTIRTQNNLYSTLLDQEVGFFDSTKTGEIISRLTSDTTKVGDQLALNVNIFCRNAIKLIGVLIFMFSLSWKLSILTLVGLPIIFEIYGTFGEYYEKLSEKVQTSLASANESAAEALASVRTVKSFGAEDIEKKRYFKKLSFTYLLKKKQSYSYGGFVCVNEFLDLALEVLILFYGGHLVLQGDLSGGHLVSFILYDLELGGCLEEIGDIYTGLMEAVGAARKVFTYLERKPKIQQNGCLAPEKFAGGITFTNVTFAYPTRPDKIALSNLSFTVKPGEVVALVGPSGGGKSTIVNLLEHFYNPQDGDILIDGIPVSSYEHKYYHTKVALVSQEPVLFARSLNENITYGIREEVSSSRITDAAIHANISQFIHGLPEGYDTQAGEKGIQLSGGQKQRVAIARALIRNPSVLILDEATSALDSESEYLIQDAINRNLKGRTVLIVAHRLSTVEGADKILVIENGMVVEQGNHNELYAKDGIYTGLVKRQLLSTDQSEPQ